MKEKENYIKDFNEAFSRNDLDFILNNMTDDIVWNFIGEKTFRGKDEVREFMEPMKKVETLEMELLQVITQENTAAANGRMKIKEPTGEIKSFEFADFYEMEGSNSPKIKKMTSYVVGIKEGIK